MTQTQFQRFKESLELWILFKSSRTILSSKISHNISLTVSSTEKEFCFSIIILLLLVSIIQKIHFYSNFGMFSHIQRVLLSNNSFLRSELKITRFMEYNSILKRHYSNGWSMLIDRRMQLRYVRSFPIDSLRSQGRTLINYQTMKN